MSAVHFNHGIPGSISVRSTRLPIVIRKDQRVAHQNVLQHGFRDEVIAHARRKATFAPALTNADFVKVALPIFDRVHTYLRNHEAATYDAMCV
jgi:hypothetical protein